MKVMFLDESGHHNLIKIDPQYPVFVLGGIIVEREYARTVLEERVQRFKRDLFGRDDLILHTADIARVSNGFEALKDDVFRQKFYDELNGLMRNLEYQVVACAIKKVDHAARHGTTAIDPYMLSLNVLIERFCFEIGDVMDGGIVIAERRRNDLDDELERAWEMVKRAGTAFQQGNTIDQRIVELVVKDKRLNIAGSQLADLVVSPIGRHVVGKRTHEDWRVVEEKFRRRNGEYRGPGLVVLPR